jgi:hypothetical protein
VYLLMFHYYLRQRGLTTYQYILNKRSKVAPNADDDEASETSQDTKTTRRASNRQKIIIRQSEDDFPMSDDVAETARTLDRDVPVKT